MGVQVGGGAGVGEGVAELQAARSIMTNDTHILLLNKRVPFIESS
jgi:hypothetical protein